MAYSRTPRGTTPRPWPWPRPARRESHDRDADERPWPSGGPPKPTEPASSPMTRPGTSGRTWQLPLQDEGGLVLIPPYDHAHVIAGQGSGWKGAPGRDRGSGAASRVRRWRPLQQHTRQPQPQVSRGGRRARGGRRRHAIVQDRRPPDRPQPVHHRRRGPDSVPGEAHVPPGSET